MADNRDYRNKLEEFTANFSQTDVDKRLLVVLPALLHFRWLDSVTLTETPSYSLQSMKDYQDFLHRILKIVALQENPTEKELDLFLTVSSVIDDLVKTPITNKPLSKK